MTTNQTDKQPSTETSDTPNVAQAKEKQPDNILVGLRIKYWQKLQIVTAVHVPTVTENLVTEQGKSNQQKVQNKLNSVNVWDLPFWIFRIPVGYPKIQTIKYNDT